MCKECEGKEEIYVWKFDKSTSFRKLILNINKNIIKEYDKFNNWDKNKRICSKCRLMLPESTYFFNSGGFKNNKQLFHRYCKVCEGTRSYGWGRNENKKFNNDNLHYCSTCDRVLPLNEIYFGKTSGRCNKTGYNSNCKECCNIGTFGLHSINNIEIFKIKNGYKVCHKCFLELPDTKHYFFQKIDRDNGDCVCKKCKGYSYGRKNTVGSNEHVSKSVDECYIENSLELLIILSKQLNRSPYKREYMKARDIYKNYSISTLEQRLGMIYSDILKTILPQYKLNRDKKIKDKQKLIDDLILLRNKLGRIPYHRDLSHNNITYGADVYIRVFKKSYSSILIDELGWKPWRNITKIKTDDELVDDFINLYKKLERIPMVEEMISENNISSYNLYKHRFGSIENLCNLLNIQYSQNSGIGFVCRDKMGSLCKSRIECLISNFFIDNKIEFFKEPSYNELVDKNTRRKFDWKIKINNNWYYVEYFGIFNVNGKSKIVQQYVKKTKRKIRDLYKAEVIDRCLFIFPNNIKKLTDKDTNVFLKSLLVNQCNFNSEAVA